jgi:hypothetical protein
MFATISRKNGRLGLVKCHKDDKTIREPCVMMKCSFVPPGFPGNVKDMFHAAETKVDTSKTRVCIGKQKRVDVILITNNNNSQQTHDFSEFPYA